MAIGLMACGIISTSLLSPSSSVGFNRDSFQANQTETINAASQNSEESELAALENTLSDVASKSTDNSESNADDTELYQSSMSVSYTKKPVSESEKLMVETPAVGNTTVNWSFKPFAHDRYNYNDGQDHMFGFVFSNKPPQLTLQQKSGNTWKNVQKSNATKQKNGLYLLKMKTPALASGKHTFRLALIGVSGYNNWYGPSQTVTVNAINVRLSTPQVPRITDNTLPTRVKRDIKAYNVTGMSGRTIYLQRYNSAKKRWDNIASQKIKNGTYYAQINLTLGAQSAGTKKFRLHTPKVNGNPAATSGTASIKYEDPRKYTGFRKKMYNYMKKYCPNVTIRVDKRNNRYDGLAYIPNDRLALVNTDGRSNASRQRFVALHECAHIIQSNAYKHDVGTLYSRLGKLTKMSQSTAIEYVANCMAFKMGGSKTYASYNKTCTSTQNSIAKKLLAGRRA